MSSIPILDNTRWKELPKQLRYCWFHQNIPLSVFSAEDLPDDVGATQKVEWLLETAWFDACLAVGDIIVLPEDPYLVYPVELAEVSAWYIHFPKALRPPDLHAAIIIVNKDNSRRYFTSELYSVKEKNMGLICEWKADRSHLNMGIYVDTETITPSNNAFVQSVTELLRGKV